MTVTRPRLHVVAAVLQRENHYFIQQRPPGKHMAGLWEFAGGKVEQGESAWSALVRELNEELGIHAIRGEPLIQLNHDYSDRLIDLDVWRVVEWAGEPVAQEQQVTGWFSLDDILSMPLLPADGPVLTAMALPHRLLITQPCEDHEKFLQQLTEEVTRYRHMMCILRQHEMDEEDYRLIAMKAHRVLRDLGCELVLSGASIQHVKLARELGIDRLHVSASNLNQVGQYDDIKWSVDCRTGEELDLAIAADTDFAVLTSVNVSGQASAENGTGWTTFRDVISTRNIPVYVGGAMQESDEVRSRLEGAQGIASSVWWS